MASSTAGRVAGLSVAARAVALLMLGAPAASQTAVGTELEGAWRPRTYVMQDGVERQVDGLIVFAGSSWLTLFFIQSGTELERGAGEGGSFTLRGDRLTLHHRFHLSAGKALPHVPETAPLRMELKPPEEASVEPCRIAIAGDRLIITFPSGNAMIFTRVR